MIGLEFIAKEFKINFSDLAVVLGISRKTVNDWVKGRRNIPQMRVRQLAEYFKLSEDHFQKELNSIEEINIRRKAVLQRSPYEEVELEGSDEEGNKYSYTHIYNDEQAVLDILNEDEKVEKILSHFQRVMKSGDEDFPFDGNAISFFDDLAHCLEDNKKKELIYIAVGILSTPFGYPFYVSAKDQKQKDIINKVRILLQEFEFVKKL